VNGIAVCQMCAVVMNWCQSCFTSGT